MADDPKSPFPWLQQPRPVAQETIQPIIPQFQYTPAPLPFQPPVTPQQDAVAQFEAATGHLQRSDVEKIRAQMAIMCEHCGELIQYADDCAELFFGVLGRSPKSGRLLPMSSHEDPGLKLEPNPLDMTVVLHYECIAPWCVDALDVDHAYSEQLCARCEEIIEND